MPAKIQAVLDLQGMIGNRATTRLLQRQSEEGSATVVGSASSEEEAADSPSFTAGMVEGEEGGDEVLFPEGERTSEFPCPLGERGRVRGDPAP